MTQQNRWSLLLLSAATVCLAGCGGAGGGVNSGGSSAVQPPAPPSATPTPPPTSTPPPPPFTAQKATIFPQPLLTPTLAVAGQGWSQDEKANPAAPYGVEVTNIRADDGFAASYDAASQSYIVTVPSVGTGMLFQTGEPRPWDADFGTVFSASVAPDAAAATNNTPLAILRSDQPGARYSYVSWAVWLASQRAANGAWTASYGVYGIAQPTALGDVPLSGTARYNGNLLGYMAGNSGDSLSGSAQFDFDFAAAKLSGNMTVSLNCFMGCSYPATQYTFADTVFGRGETGFSGGLTTNGAPSLGSFSGVLAGPGAAELMAGFKLPFFDPNFGRWVPAGGVILAKKN